MVWQKMPCGGEFDSDTYCLGEDPNSEACKTCPSKYSNYIKKKLGLSSLGVKGT